MHLLSDALLRVGGGCFSYWLASYANEHFNDPVRRPHGLALSTTQDAISWS